MQGANKIQSTGVLSSSKNDESNPEAYTFTAHFAKAGAVVVESADELLGGALIDKPSNAVGDQVTLTATADMFAGRFTGWKTPSGAVVKDNPYTFTVTEANKGIYIANYAKSDVSTTGIYCYVHNLGHPRSLGLMGISDKTVSRDNRYLKNSIMLLEDGSDIMRSSPAFVLKLTGSPDGSGGFKDANLEAQGMGSKTISGKTFTFTNQGDYFYIQGSAGSVSAYMVDYADAFTQEEHLGKVNHPGIYNGPAANDKQFRWVVTPITELSKDFCFGAMPSPKTKDEAGKYYTTMYTKFPYRCLDGVKAYVVSSVDATAHKVVLSEIKSGEVPSGTPVVLECTSTKPVENRLLPLVEEPAAIAETNLLKGEIWLKDENKTEDEYRTKFDSQTMLVLSNDELAFKNVNNTDVLASGTVDVTVTDTLTYIANNTCYLTVDSKMAEVTTFTIEKGETKETTLAGLSQEAADGVTPYKLTGDDLECVAAIASDSYKYLVVKDGGHSTETTSNKQGYREYLIRSSYNGGKENTTRQTAYDQSNWILVDLSGITGAQVDNYRNCKIASITGTYHKENPRFVATQIVLGDKTAPYAPNHYIATNFMTTYSPDGTGNGVKDAAGNTYYFMNPKDGEWAIVAWAVWDKATQAFYVPAKDDEGTNAHGFAGGFKVDLRYNEGDITDVKRLDEQSDKGQNVYTFPALIVKNTATSASAPQRAAITPDTRKLSTTYTVYPLSLSARSVVTGVSTVDQAKTVSSVVYYNLQGMASPTPHAGLNVVVTRYTDGSTQVAKVMRP
ncbi:InlB B-repeat-containing protein [Sodaliphilus pleomorphus]|uniref:InlB B-repeat-containing protein n=1 Tax=Sodaliphilus pleomorphus TaxID=2606626 RepID=UPI0038B2C1D1